MTFILSNQSLQPAQKHHPKMRQNFKKTKKISFFCYEKSRLSQAALKEVNKITGACRFTIYGARKASVSHLGISTPL
jgi:hypothetical protein